MAAGALQGAGQSTSYLMFIVPLAFIGAGFVLSTTVRTAIVFASTPRGLPSSAAAINEASVGLGSRIGIVAGTAALATVALDSARAMVVDHPDADALVEEFRLALLALGTPQFKQTLAALEGAPAVKIAAYNAAYLDGVIAALIISGVVGVSGGIVAWLLTGRRDPLASVFDLREERGAAPDEAAAI